MSCEGISLRRRGWIGKLNIPCILRNQGTTEALGADGWKSMIWTSILSVIAIVVSVVAVRYARAAALEAKKGNDLSRLSALIALRSHYMELARSLDADIKQLAGTQTQKELQKQFEGLAQKVLEVTREIQGYHDALTRHGT